MWTPRHARLLDALESTALLPAMRQALALDEPAERADRHLLLALQEATPLKPAMRLLEQGETEALRRAVLGHYPTGLDPVVVHHLSRAWLGHRDLALHERALRGMMFLVDRQSEHLLRVASVATDPETAQDVLPSILPSVLEPELAPIRALGTLDADPAAARRALDVLERTLAGAATDGVSEATRSEVQTRIDAALTTAAEQVTDIVERTVDEAEQRRVDGARAHLGDVFDDALAFVDVAGHQSVLTITVVEKAVEMAWPLHQADEHEHVRALLRPVRPFVDDLATRLRGDEAFGRQGVFADYYVMRSSAVEETRPVPRLRRRRELLQRGWAVCPIHHNTRLLLTSVDLTLAEHLLQMRNQELRPGKRSALLREARALVREAEAIDPEHERLAAVKAMLES